MRLLPDNPSHLEGTCPLDGMQETPLQQHMPSLHLCTIVICTLALKQRAESLRKAIDSVLLWNECLPAVLVVVNGSRFDVDLVNELRARRDIQFLQIETGSSPAALLAGRCAIATPHFGFLDDDDEYLPGAVDARLAALAANPDTDIVVTNGWRHKNGSDAIAMRRLAQMSGDPLRTLFDENWLASCGGLYRTDAVPVSYFEDLPRHIHWSWLAFRLAQDGKRISPLSSLTFRINDTSDSSSKSDTYLLCQVEVYRRMLGSTNRSDIVRLLRRRLAQAWHDIASHYLHRGNLGKSWAAHMRSVCHPSGWKFATFTLRLIQLQILGRQPKAR